MKATEQLQAQIERSTQRLAHLRAREIIAQQRSEAKKRAASKRTSAQKRQELGGYVIAAGCGDMAPAELVGALRSYQTTVTDTAAREHYRKRGEAFLATSESGRGGETLH